MAQRFRLLSALAYATLTGFFAPSGPSGAGLLARLARRVPVLAGTAAGFCAGR